MECKKFNSKLNNFVIALIISEISFTPFVVMMYPKNAISHFRSSGFSICFFKFVSGISFLNLQYSHLLMFQNDYVLHASAIAFVLEASENTIHNSLKHCRSIVLSKCVGIYNVSFQH